MWEGVADPMFKALINGIKNFFADDTDELEPEALVALVLDESTPEERRKEGAESLSSLSDKLGEMSGEDPAKAGIANRSFASLQALLERPGQPEWISVGAVNGMNEIINVCRYEMDPAVLEAGINSLISRAGSGHPDELRSSVSMCLSSFDDKVSADATRRAREALLVNVREATGEVRADSLHSLGSLDSEYTQELWPEVATYLDDADAKVRACATSALWMIGNEEPDPAVLDKLIAVMQRDSSEETRSDAANSLGQLGSDYPPAIEAVTAALHDAPVRHMAIFALLDFEEAAAAAVPDLARYIDDTDHEDGVVMALQAIGTEEARALLRSKGHDEEG